MHHHYHATSLALHLEREQQKKLGNKIITYHFNMCLQLKSFPAGQPSSLGRKMNNQTPMPAL